MYCNLRRFHITCSTVVPQCYRRQAIPIEQAKIRLSLTLYSLDRSLSNLVRLIMSATPTCMPFWLNLVGWRIPRKYVKYNLSVTFCSVPFFRAHAWSKNPWTDLHDRWLKTREIRQGCAFWGFDQKLFTPPLIFPKFRKFCITKAVFSHKTRIYLGGSAAKTLIRIGNSPWRFQIWG